MDIIKKHMRVGGDNHIKLLLKIDNKNMGFFNVDDSNLNSVINDDNRTISGTCVSRLVELEKTKQTNIFTNKYYSSTNVDVDGVNYNISDANNITYYIGGIIYNDNIIENKTTYSFNGLGCNSNNCINGYIFLDESKINSIMIPDVENDINVERFNTSIIEPFFKISKTLDMNNIYNVEGGSYFKIINNE